MKTLTEFALRYIHAEMISDSEFCSTLRSMATMALASAETLEGSVGYGKPWPLGSRGNGSLGDELR